MADEKVVCIQGETKKLDSREDVADIVRKIEECEGLTTLQLSGNSFGVEATKAIGDALAKKPTFSRALWSDMFVSRLKSEIPPALIALGKGIMAAESILTELDLSDNAFGPTGVQPIIPLLTSSSFYSIKVLKFNNNGLGITGGKILSRALLQCHEEAQGAGQKLALEVFVAGRNRLENDGAMALSQVFEAMGSLVHISMPQNGITADGICSLATSFKSNPNLQVIDLNDNTFTEVGSKSMAQVLPSLQKLRVINFGDCLVRPEGARAIASAIGDSHQLLEEVNLSFCELNQDAGLAVAAAVANKKALKKIDLNGNSFGENGIELLRGSLEAKGLTDALGTLSDDEGSEGEGEEEGEGEGEVRDDLTETSQIDDDDSTETLKETLSEAEALSQKFNDLTITLEEYLCDPCGENLLALGEGRNKILLNYLTSGRNQVSQEARAAALFVKVTSDYFSVDATVQRAIESVVDAILQPVFQDNLALGLIDEILVQIGLLKSEDKSFVPTTEIEGPSQALVHVAKSSYFTKMNADVLIAFFTKPSPVLIPLQRKGIVYRLLQTLHTL